MNLRKIYHEHSAAEAYLLGFMNNHERQVYAFIIGPERLDTFIVDDTTAEEEGGERFPSIRYRIQRGQRDKLQAGMLPDWSPLGYLRRVCTEKELTAWARANKCNLGEAFEALACERLGLKRNPNPCEAWWNGPDAWDKDGRALQIGYEGKTFTYTAQCERQGWA